MQTENRPAQRICSLLPSATEIVCALGLADRLVAVTHECDYPPEAVAKPRISTNAIQVDSMTGREIDQAVRDSLAEQATIYHLDEALLRQLEPDLILTQELCDVCAVGPDLVRQAVASLPFDVRVLSAEPTTLEGVLESILIIGRITGTLRRAFELVSSLSARLEAVKHAVQGQPVIPVLTLEWLDPVFVGGHWVPEMVRFAGGRDVLGEEGKPSREAAWEEIAGTAPEVTVAMPCGYGLERSRNELLNTRFPGTWEDLPATRNGRVYAVDGSSYFNRPGPRLVDGVEILAAILHPEVWDRMPESAAERIDLQRV